MIYASGNFSMRYTSGNILFNETDTTVYLFIFGRIDKI